MARYDPDKQAFVPDDKKIIVSPFESVTGAEILGMDLPPVE